MAKPTPKTVAAPDAKPMAAQIGQTDTLKARASVISLPMSIEGSRQLLCLPRPKQVQEGPASRVGREGPHMEALPPQKSLHPLQSLKSHFVASAPKNALQDAPETSRNKNGPIADSHVIPQKR
eukprot:TRINITY_DN59984_c0_g1_i1.p2 TRINITY_DN59984_c0_g1~~TRINITY_DN59984_c0_g1_i1.p2  ORF type:complete len:123 (-),score=6.22 TRINITY_DN59984_c0_g1_i1:8-376(-)